MDRRRARALMLGTAGLATVVGVIALFLIGPPPRSLGEPAVPGRSEAVASVAPLLSTEDIYAAFAEGGTATSGGEPTVLSAVPAGDIVLPSGQVVAADVFFFNTEPFIRRLPPGRHPVLLLSSARDPDVAGDVAAAMIRAAPGDPVSWELALVPGQDASTLQAGEFFGYGVDSGTGCFASAEAVAVVTAGDFDAYSDQVQDGMFPSDDAADWKNSVNVVVDQASGANVVGFTSGFGDGGYPSWFGLDADGEPLVLLTDFGILEAPAP